MDAEPERAAGRRWLHDSLMAQPLDRTLASTSLMLPSTRSPHPILLPVHARLRLGLPLSVCCCYIVNGASCELLVLAVAGCG